MVNTGALDNVSSAADLNITLDLADDLSGIRYIFIAHLDGVLLLDVNASLAQAVHQRVLIHFLQVAMTMIHVNGIGSLTDDIAQFVDGFHGVWWF